MKRPQQGGGNHMFIGSRPTPAVTGLLVAVITAFVVRVFLTQPLRLWVDGHLALVPSQALGPQPWQLLTSLFIAPDFPSVLLEALSIWFIATPVEARAGKWRMLGLFGVAHVVGALVAAGIGRLSHIDAPMGGASHAITALLVAFGVLYDKVPMRLFGVAEMRARSIALLFLGIGLVVGVLNAITSGDYRGLVAQLAAIGVGFAMMSGGIAKIEIAYQRWRLKRLRRRYRVIPGGRDGRRYLN